MRRFRLTTNKLSVIAAAAGIDDCATMSLHVRVVDANDVEVPGSQGWMFIMSGGAVSDGWFIRATSPPFVGPVIRGFTLTLPPPVTRAGC